MDEKPSPKGRGRSFKKGKSGNPAGRPKGARNRTTLAAEALLNGEAETLIRKALKRALEDDDNVALRMCLDRVLPVRRERRVSITLPPIKSAEDAAKAMDAILEAVASAKISPSEAVEIAKLVETRIKAIEVVDLEQRIALLETGAPPDISEPELQEMITEGEQPVQKMTLEEYQHEKGNGTARRSDGATQVWKLSSGEDYS